MDRKAMDERNMRERFWRLRERTKIQSLQPKPCWNVSRGSKGQSSRERGMDRKAMDERNMRERFWRLRERALVDKLHDILPDSYKSVKVSVRAVLRGAREVSLRLQHIEQKVVPAPGGPAQGLCECNLNW